MSEVDSPEQALPKSGKHLHWRRDPRILERMQEVDRLHLLGRANTSIAITLGVDESTIRYDLKRINELYRERVADSHEELLGQAIRRLEHVMRLGLEAYDWDLECEDAVLFGGDQIDGAEGNGKRVVYRDQKGSAQFRGNKAAALQVAAKAAMDIAKLQGLVVDKVAPTGADGKTLDLAALVLRLRETRQDDSGS